MNPTELVPARIGEVELLIEVRDEGGIAEAGLADVLDISILRDAIESVAISLQSAWQKAKPDEAEIEFSVGCAVKSGKLWAVLAEGSADAAIKVTLKWTKPEP